MTMSFLSDNKRKYVLSASILCFIVFVLAVYWWFYHRRTIKTNEFDMNKETFDELIFPHSEVNKKAKFFNYRLANFIELWYTKIHFGKTNEGEYETIKQTAGQANDTFLRFLVDNADTHHIGKNVLNHTTFKNYELMRKMVYDNKWWLFYFYDNIELFHKHFQLSIRDKMMRWNGEQSLRLRKNVLVIHYRLGDFLNNGVIYPKDIFNVYKKMYRTFPNIRKIKKIELLVGSTQHIIYSNKMMTDSDKMYDDLYTMIKNDLSVNNKKCEVSKVEGTPDEDFWRGCTSEFILTGAGMYAIMMCMLNKNGMCFTPGVKNINFPKNGKIKMNSDFHKFIDNWYIYKY